MVVALVWLGSFGSASGTLNLSARDSADIQRIEAYLNSLKTLRSRFIQISAGNFAEGVIYIDRPNKLRLEYTIPSHIQVYANGFWLTHVDNELEAVWHTPIKATPATFLVRDTIALNGDISVKGLDRKPGSISIELAHTKQPGTGRFVLIFSDDPLNLRKWTITDAQGVSTSVTLMAAEFNVAIPGAVFVFDETKF